MISTTSEYALRALVVLAAKGGAAMQARELAAATEVPSSYLYKILATLRRAGLLAGSRGSRGGYALAREPQQVRLLDVVSLFEVVRPNESCLLSERHPCSDQNPCSAHQHWKQVEKNYRDFLTTRTVADLATNEGS